MLPPAIALFSAPLKQEGHAVDLFDATYYQTDHGIDSDGTKATRLNIESTFLQFKDALVVRFISAKVSH